MRIAITGATGFVGSRLWRVLRNEGCTTAAIVRPSSVLSGLEALEPEHTCCFTGDCASLAGFFKSFQPDAVIHLASCFIAEHTMQDIPALLDGNICFGTCLLGAMEAGGCRALINTGTAWQHLHDEEYNPVNLYAATKQAFEDICRFYQERFSFKVMHLHLCDTYGEGDTRRKLLNLLLENAGSGQVIPLSPGEQVINMVHVADVCEAYPIAIRKLAAMPASSSGTFAVRSTENVSLRDLIAMFNAAKPSEPVSVEWGARAYRAREVMKPWQECDVLDGWHPKVGLAEGLRRLRLNERR